MPVSPVTRNRILLIRAVQKVVDRTAYGGGLLLEMLLRSDPFGHYVSVSQDDLSLISYARKTSERLDTKRRVKVALGRYVRRNLKVGPDKISDKELADIAGKVKSLVAGDEYFTVVSGDQLIEAYETGFGGSSCMTGDRASKYLCMYEDNPDKVSLVKYYDPEKCIAGRAILWTTDSGVKVLDRIYPSDSGAQVDAMEEWARRRGIITRKTRGFGEGTLSDNKTYSITLPEPGAYPYLDTFWVGYYADDGRIRLTNREDRTGNNHADFYCQETSGRNSNGDGLTNSEPCAECGEEAMEDVQYTDGNDVYCYDCFHALFAHCDECGRLMDRDDVQYSPDGESLCYGCFDNAYTVCEHCDDVTPNDEISETIYGKMLCIDCLESLGYKECAECTELFTGTEDLCEDCR